MSRRQKKKAVEAGPMQRRQSVTCSLSTACCGACPAKNPPNPTQKTYAWNTPVVQASTVSSLGDPKEMRGVQRLWVGGTDGTRSKLMHHSRKATRADRHAAWMVCSVSSFFRFRVMCVSGGFVRTSCAVLAWFMLRCSLSTVKSRHQANLSKQKTGNVQTS